MKILLLNDNPVVNKLVTLSAQKTSDELEVVDNVSDINIGTYDLLVVDDTLYTDDLMSQVKEKISFSQSLYICARDAVQSDEFSTTIKKPFLPTDLVELFSSLGKKVESQVSEAIEEIPLEDASELDELESNDLLDNEDLGDEISLEELSLDLDTGDMGDNKASQKIDLDNLDELASEGFLDDLDDLDELEEIEAQELEPENTLEDTLETNPEGILDKDDLKEVQDLLELDDDLDSLDLEDDLDLELDLDDMILEDGTLESDATDELDLEEELVLDLNESEKTIDETLDDLDVIVPDIQNETELDSLDEEEVLDLDEIDTNSEDIKDTSIEDLEADVDEVLELDEESLELQTDDISPEENILDMEDDLVEELGLEEDLDLGDVVDLEEESLDLGDAVDLEDDLELALGDEIVLDDEMELEVEESLEEPESLNLEDQILNAVSELSQEDLESEVDTKTLLDIATSEIDSIDDLNSRDLKMAFGEEVPEIEEPEEEVQEVEEASEEDDIATLSDLEITPDTEGVESLKKLLEALSNKDVAASMKGMKISINIELGDK